MKKVYKLEQLEELKQKYTKEVIESVKEVIVVINESYGTDRDVDKDLGGYILLAESEEDITDIKEYISYRCGGINKKYIFDNYEIRKE